MLGERSSWSPTYTGKDRRSTVAAGTSRVSASGNKVAQRNRTSQIRTYAESLFGKRNEMKKTYVG